MTTSTFTGEELWIAKIPVEFGSLNPVMEWCVGHCRGQWHVDFAGTVLEPAVRNYYSFSFSDEQDYLIFTLKYI